MTKRKMVLAGFFYNPQGDHRMSWRHEDAPGHDFLDFDYYRNLVKVAEKAKLDVVFIADHLAVWDERNLGLTHYANPRLDPVALVAALSAVTKDIGFLVTASTSYSEPYNIARTFASIDHIGQGRVGWNIVTSPLDEEAQNFGRDANPLHAVRYERADEFVDVTKALWDSWEQDSLTIDKNKGVFADRSRIHYLNHIGKYFQVKGPLNVGPSPQGRPLLVQAGSSKAGMNLAAKHADLHFAIFQDIAGGLAYRAQISELLERNGRRADDLRILAGIVPIVGKTTDEAQKKQAYLETLMVDDVAIAVLSTWCGIDLFSFPPDGPMPPLPEDATHNGWKTWLNLVRLQDKKLSIRQLARKITHSGSVPFVIGTPSQVADQLEAWFTSGAVDGFNLMFPILPNDWTDFMELVVPELQARGLFQTEYTPGNLREKLCFQAAVNRWTVERQPRCKEQSASDKDDIVNIIE